MVLARLILCALLHAAIVAADKPEPPSPAQVAAWVAESQARGLPDPVFIRVETFLYDERGAVILITEARFPMSLERWCAIHGPATDIEVNMYKTRGWFQQFVRLVRTDVL